MCWSGEHQLPRCLEHVMLLALFLLLFLFIIVFLFFFFKPKSQDSSVFWFDLFNMLLTDMDVGKTVLRERSEAANWWAWSVIPLEKQKGNNSHTCSLYFAVFWHVVWIGKTRRTMLLLPNSWLKKLSCKLQTLHLITKYFLTVYDIKCYVKFKAGDTSSDYCYNFTNVHLENK